MLPLQLLPPSPLPCDALITSFAVSPFVNCRISIAKRSSVSILYTPCNRSSHALLTHCKFTVAGGIRGCLWATLKIHKVERKSSPVNIPC